MPVIKYRVILSQQERSRLLKLVSKGTESVRKILHANILLAADENTGKKLSEKEIADQFHVNYQTVHTIRKTYATAGLDTALGRKKRRTPPVPAKITGDIEARVIALSCSEPPEGRARWTLRLLANKAVELQYIDSISHEAVGQLLKKTNSNRI
jgi:transposase